MRPPQMHFLGPYLSFATLCARTGGGSGEKNVKKSQEKRLFHFCRATTIKRILSKSGTVGDIVNVINRAKSQLDQ
jgi:hypothetical protein